VGLVNPAEGRKNSGKSLAEIKTRIPKRAFDIINQLVSRGYFSSVADFARQSILDKLISDFEIGISELEPQILKPKHDKKKEYIPTSSSANLEA
jgi:Arc/MetJ-type ribon-helix-helix transcriptional regulator